ncbi:Cell division protein FtsA [Sporomusa ovata DSM 2662]|uniref:Type IV pilus biogenesis protein PilM n=1 Tax=Sporomusa ovata TaxID=2378 RepID=A0A0U1KUX5_9FIRM|nr:type IV pilus assembly protein PilM [Sporomusa ovata]EQB29211.1 type IV pilus assembly protein PilM [Sporomusa ovata DSM 2662]CQR71247.1 Type IV pilus biogenesis protein PilM [Sporomusa ovata]
MDHPNRFATIASKLGNWLIKQPASAVGIDIGSSCVKAAEISFSNGQKELRAVGLLDLPENVMEEGFITNAKALTEAIRQLLINSGIVSREVVVAVSGRLVFVREVMLPVMNQAEIKEAIKWDMEKYVPYEPGSYYYDFAVVGPGNNELEIKVLLVAAPHELVNTLVNVIKQADCRLIAVDIEPLAIYRLLSNAENAMIIDIGSHISHIMLFQGASPVVSRFIPIGGLSFTEVIMRTLELDYAEAERLKKCQTGQNPNFEGEQLFMYQQIDLLVDELAREVRRTVEYYQVQNREAAVDKLYLTGGGAKLTNLPQHIAAKLGGVPVLLHNPLTAVTLSPGIDTRYLQDMALQFALSIGLAMRGGKP